jgi:hypothetical protein
MDNVICTQCQRQKPDLDYYKNAKGKVILPCKACVKLNNKNYYRNNQYEISQRKKSHYIENKDEVLGRSKKYQTNNKKKISLKKKVYYQKNREDCIKRTAKYRSTSLRNFYANHKNDPEYRIRKRVSFAIARSLKKNGSSKNFESCLKYLPYAIQGLKIHLENLFEPWMTWQNWGNYKKETWDDNDISTWTWQIDHIIPHSTFQYSSMEDESFKKCWALENLRPLSAKLNNFDGANRTRHPIKD